MNRGHNFFRRLRWAGLLTVLLLATYPLGFYFSMRRLYERLQAKQLPHRKWALPGSRMRMPGLPALTSQRSLGKIGS